MIVIRILSWDKSRAWTDWSGHARKQLAGSIQDACPSMGITDVKRLAKSISKGAIADVRVENPKYAESLSHILESTGAAVSVIEISNDQVPISD